MPANRQSGLRGETVKLQSDRLLAALLSPKAKSDALKDNRAGHGLHRFINLM